MSNTTAPPLLQWQWFWYFPLAFAIVVTLLFGLGFRQKARTAKSPVDIPRQVPSLREEG